MLCISLQVQRWDLSLEETGSSTICGKIIRNISGDIGLIILGEGDRIIRGGIGRSIISDC